MSPLQYQKQLRLVAARERMLVEGIDAASAAFEVGYESASQFNREYKRFFGQPPMRDIKVRRLGNGQRLTILQIILSEWSLYGNYRWHPPWSVVLMLHNESTRSETVSRAIVYSGRVGPLQPKLFFFQ
jgi:hypothetical protein